MDQTTGVIISAAIAAVVSIIVNISSGYLSRRKMYAETASSERINWIREMRESTIELISLCETFDSFDSLDREQQLAFNKAKTSIIVHLNPSVYGYGNDNELYGLIADKSYNDIKANRIEIAKLVSTICKDEWDKVKIESGRTKAMRKAARRR